jgi:hypothetical protein
VAWGARHSAQCASDSESRIRSLFDERSAADGSTDSILAHLRVNGWSAKTG